MRSESTCVDGRQRGGRGGPRNGGDLRLGKLMDGIMIANFFAASCAEQQI